jgi:serine/threonine protein kinase
VTSKFNDRVKDRASDGASDRVSDSERVAPLDTGSGRLLHGRYRVERVLGEREGVVTALARDRSTNAQVVLRHLTSHSPWDDVQIEERAAAIAQLASEHTARLSSWFPGETTGTFYFVSEYLRGENLGIILERQGRIELTNAVDYLLQACDAVAEAHAQSLVHGSLRNTSLFLTGGAGPEHIQLLDFELLPWGSDEDERPTLPPELLSGAPRAGPHSDIWSLGVVLYQLVTGEPPFATGGGPSGSGAGRLAPLPAGNPRSVAQPDLAPPATLRTLEQVIERCLSRHVSDRFTSVMELALRLLPLAPPDSAGQQLWRTRLKRTPLYPQRNYRKTPGASGIEVRGPFLRGATDDSSEPLIAARRMSGTTPSLDGVQFSIFRPRRIQPGTHYRLLAFAHRERFANAPDPLDEVQRQAQQMLERASGGDAEAPISAGRGVPHQSALTFVPMAEGIEFMPSRKTIRWREGVQRAEFRLRAGAGPGGLRRGRVSVYLGALLIGDVPLQLRVSPDAPDTGEIERVSAAAYRKVYAAYSGGDEVIIEQLTALADAFGDPYLTDLNELRSGEQWSQRLAEMIREADVFQLFWSERAMSSAFVRGEWEYALALGRPEGFIRPVYWETPRPEAPGLPSPRLDRCSFQYIGIDQPPPPIPDGDQTLRVPRPAELERLARARLPSMGTLRQRLAARLGHIVATRRSLSTPRLLIAASFALGVGLLVWRKLSDSPPNMVPFDRPVPVLMYGSGLDRDKAVAAAEELRERAGRASDSTQPPVSLFVSGMNYSVLIGPYADLEAARDARRRAALGSSLVLDLWGECVSHPLFLGELEGFPAYFCKPPKDPTEE